MSILCSGSGRLLHSVSGGVTSKSSLNRQLSRQISAILSWYVGRYLSQKRGFLSVGTMAGRQRFAKYSNGDIPR